MRTPASIAGHPIHPMLVPIAIGGFILSLAFDIVSRTTGHTDPWVTVAYYTMVGAIVGALAAAIFGLVDLISLPAGAAKRAGVIHMVINLTVVGLYVVNAWMRAGSSNNQGTPFVLSIVGILLLLVSGWLGGKMVYEHGVGVSGADALAATRTTNRP
jgi:uncharacterized membrane protein